MEDVARKHAGVTIPAKIDSCAKSELTASDGI